MEVDRLDFPELQKCAVPKKKRLVECYTCSTRCATMPAIPYLALFTIGRGRTLRLARTAVLWSEATRWRQCEYQLDSSISATGPRRLD